MDLAGAWLVIWLGALKESRAFTYAEGSLLLVPSVPRRTGGRSRRIADEMGHGESLKSWSRNAENRSERVDTARHPLLRQTVQQFGHGQGRCPGACLLRAEALNQGLRLAW